MTGRSLRQKQRLVLSTRLTGNQKAKSERAFHGISKPPGGAALCLVTPGGPGMVLHVLSGKAVVGFWRHGKSLSKS